MISSFEDKMEFEAKLTSILIAKQLQKYGYDILKYQLCDGDIYGINCFVDAIKIVFGKVEFISGIEEEWDEFVCEEWIINDPDLLILDKLLARHPNRETIFKEIEKSLFGLYEADNTMSYLRDYIITQEVGIVMNERLQYSSIYLNLFLPAGPCDFLEEVEIFLQYKRKLKKYIDYYRKENEGQQGRSDALE